MLSSPRPMRSVQVQQGAAWINSTLEQLEPNDVWRYTDTPDQVWIAREFAQPASVHADRVEVSSLDNAIRAVFKQPASEARTLALTELRKNRTKESFYQVVEGDTLSDLAFMLLKMASRYQAIATLNGILNPNLIYVGQWLRIPAYEE